MRETKPGCSRFPAMILRSKPQPEPRLEAQLIDTGARKWSNYHRVYTQPVRALYDLWNPQDGTALDRYNATTREIGRLIEKALSSRVRLRAFGAGWSWSGAPATDGFLLNTKPLNLYFILPDFLATSNPRHDPQGLRFVQCGNSIADLEERARSERRSLRTSGASNGQTIAGALSTGTHGSSVDVGAVPEYVVGLHLVVGLQKHYFLQRASDPVVSHAFAGLIDAQLISDDKLFEAALVSFGSFGIIHGVMIETEPNFLLELHRIPMKLDAKLSNSIATLSFDGLSLPRPGMRPFHFELGINPYDPKSVLVTVAYKRPYPEKYERPKIALDGTVPGENLMATIGTLVDDAPGIASGLGALTKIAFGVLGAPRIGTLGEVFSPTTTRGHSASTAIGLPLEDAHEVAQMALRIIKRVGPFPGIVALRFVKQSSATLGFTHYGPYSAILELDGVQSAHTTRVYRAVWLELARCGCAHTWHWGKMLDPSPTEIRDSYGGNVDSWLKAREELLDAPTRQVFNNAFLTKLGLAN